MAGVEGYLHTVDFHSRKINKHEIDYEIHDKELLAITSVFKEWSRYLEGAINKINIYTDHEELKWFANNKPLNCRQARPALVLYGFDSQIIHCTGIENGKADALSGCAEFRPVKGGQGYYLVEHVLEPEQWIQNDYSENTEVIVLSVMIKGICPVVEFSKYLKMEIVEKAADNVIWREEYGKARESHVMNGEVLVATICKDGLF